MPGRNRNSSVKGYFRQLSNADSDNRLTLLRAIHQYGAPRDYTRAILLCDGIDRKREEKKRKEEEKKRKKEERESLRSKERRMKKEEKDQSNLRMQQLENSMEIHIKHLLDPSLIDHKGSEMGKACPICGITVNEYKHVIDINRVQIEDAENKQLQEES